MQFFVAAPLLQRWARGDGQSALLLCSSRPETASGGIERVNCRCGASGTNTDPPGTEVVPVSVPDFKIYGRKVHPENDLKAFPPLFGVVGVAGSNPVAPIDS